MTENTNFIGNLSTIIKFISMTIAGYLIGLATSNGLNLPIDTTALSETIATILFFIIAYIDAKYPNTLQFLGNAKKQTEQQLVLKEIVLNEEYTTTSDDEDKVDGDGC